jgi:GH25 family lysozyme M1 (1,4-beta-N-acetylmuramidase)
MSVWGVEISEYQGNVDWGKLRSAGPDFVMLRAGYGDGIIDLQFRKNAKTCNREGIPCGAYWESYACSAKEARREAEHCVQTVEEFQIAYPLCMEISEGSVRYAQSRGVLVTEEMKREFSEAFCDRAGELGYFAMGYGKFQNFLRISTILF